MGNSMWKGHKLDSTSGKYRFTLKDDGDLILYNTRTGETVRNTRTWCRGDRFEIQNDANLVLYKDPERSVSCTSGTDGRNAGGRMCYFKVRNDGRAVLMMDQEIIWST